MKQLTDLLTYLNTPWSRVLLEKLTGFQLVKKLPAFYGTRSFITTFISLHDTTANIYYKQTVHHKAATELLWVMIRTFFRLLI